VGTELFRHVRGVVLVGYVVAWNALLAAGMWAGGSWDFKSTAARVFLLVALLGTTGLGLAIAYWDPVQTWALRSRENLPGLRKDLWFIVLLTGLGAAATAASFFAPS